MAQRRLIPQRSSRPFAVLGAALAVVLVLTGLGVHQFISQRMTPPPANYHPANCAPQAQAAPFVPASYKGLNYGGPDDLDGNFVGTEWLRADNWAQTSVRLNSDLTIIQQNHMGNVLRVFIGLDQLMVWDRNTGFVRFDPQALDRFDQALRIFRDHGLQVILVLYDQEVAGSAGNFHVQALDGNHAEMRTNYLRATQQFMQRFGSTPGVLGWDLFNEAYNSLSTDGGLAHPGYSSSVVHAWIHDLYRAAKCGAPQAWLTISDTTELYGNDHPNLNKYQDSVDYYDIHIYNDNPELKDWQAILHKPVIIGEAGADEGSDHLHDQAINASAVHSILVQGQPNQIRTVLAHSENGSITFTRDGKLTPTGQVVSTFGAS